MAHFYLFAPFLLVGLYTYFHLYLQRLWESLADLPAIFPDGTPLDKKADPWLLIGLVRAHLPLLRANRPHLSRLQQYVAVPLAWWGLPATMVLFWLRYLPAHDWAWTGLHTALVGFSAGMAVMLRRLAVATLSAEAPRPAPLRQSVRRFKTWKPALVFLCTAFAFGLFSAGAIEGLPCRDYRLKMARAWVPCALKTIRYSPFAELQEAEVSTKPANWAGKMEDIGSVKGAFLRGRKLRYADAHRAFLVKADLRGADLREADLREADLTEGTDLSMANLSSTNLEKATLLGANLQGARLHRANLANANLEKADLQKALLLQSKLQKANLQRANLGRAHMQEAQLQEASLQEADLRNAYAREASFYKANLLEANLQDANLGGANLQEANMAETRLRGANLHKDLS